MPQRFHKVKNFEKNFKSPIQPSRLNFYSIAVLIEISVNHIWLKKIHERFGIATYFFLEDLVGLPGLPKKIMGSGGPPSMGPQDPQIQHFEVPGPHRE